MWVCAGVVVILVLTVMTGTARAADDPLRASQWYLDAVGADAAQRVSLGTGITVAVVDSGVDATHPDLAGSVINGPDFIDGDDTPDDENGHGTAVAGIIAAHARNGIGILGAAPGVKILAVRILGADREGTTAIEARGIDAAVALGAKVINLSVATAPDAATALLPSSDIVQALERAGNAGVVVVAAAGNDAQPLCAQPILATKIVCVGAVDRQRQLSSYSNYGLRVDMVAPGGETTNENEAIVSTGRGGGYVASAGTSEATPQVAATVALLMSLGLSGPAAIDRLEQTVTDLGPVGQDLTYGRGLLNMAAAVEGLGPEAASSSPSVGGSFRPPTKVTSGALVNKGLRVRCRLSTTGRCSVRLETLSNVPLGQTGRKLAADAAATLVVKLTAKGRRAIRQTKRCTLLARATFADGTQLVRRITVRP